jgi:hypothetical protein
MAVARPHRVVFSCCYGEMTAVALERATRRKPSTRSEATMCWGKLSRHPGRAHAWPLCGPWPRPHLAASKLVELRSSVNLVAMPHQPLDRYVAPLADPGLRDVRYAHIAPPLGCLGIAALRLPLREPKGKRHQPRAVLGSPRCGWPLRPALAPVARLAQPVARMLLVSVHDESHWLRWQGSLRKVARRSFRVGIIALTSRCLGAITFSC